MFMNRKNLGFH